MSHGVGIQSEASQVPTTQVRRPLEGRDQGVPLSVNWDDPFQVSCKRMLDVVGSGSLLAVLSPLLFFVAVLVKLTSRGPIFYRWRVVGKNGQPFVGYKFRSMVANADQMRARLRSRNEMEGPVFKITDDPRITPLGRWLRKYSIDELPQLWSVLKGDMSLVGPRPPLQSEFERFTEWQRLKLHVKPGITCLWQVSGRNEIKNFDDWVRLDLQYMKCWSILLDIKILIRTIPVVIFGKGK